MRYTNSYYITLLMATVAKIQHADITEQVCGPSNRRTETYLDRVMY